MQRKNKKKSLNREFTIMTMFTSVSALVLFGAVMLALFFIFFHGDIREDMENTLKNTQQEYREKIQFIQDGGVAIRHNAVLKDFFSGNWSDREEMEKQLSYSMELFSERNMAVQQKPFVVSVCLFNRKGEYVKSHYYPMTASAARLKELSYQSLQQEFREGEELYRVTRENGEIVLCFRIYDEQMQETGTCAVGIDEKAMDVLFQEIENFDNGSWMVLSSRDAVLAYGGELKKKGEIKRRDEIKQWIAAGRNTAGERKTGGIQSLYRSETAGFGMSAVVAVGMNNIYRILKPTFLTFVGVIVLTLLFLAFFNLGVSYRFSRPLKKMGEVLRDFCQKNFDVRMEDSSIQEIADISIVFNDMADRIKYLVEQVYEKQLLATQAQVKYLQAQINPHFQFNILAMFSIKAKLAGNEELYQGLQAFSRLVQGKIFREKEVKIPVSEEMELVNFYLYLQKSRFDDKLVYEIHCEEEMGDFLIPRLLIEAIVENAVSHGIEPKSGEGKVEVELFLQEEKLHITVSDDGVGYVEEKKSEDRGEQNGSSQEEKTEEGSTLTEIPDKISHTHTGMENTRRLLQILYGENYSLNIYGEKNVGTKVEIILPAEKRGGTIHVESSGGRR